MFNIAQSEKKNATRLNFKNFNVKSLKYFRTDSLCQIKPSNFTGVDPAIPHFCRMGNVRGHVDSALQNITVLTVLTVPLNKMNNNTGDLTCLPRWCVWRNGNNQVPIRDNWSAVSLLLLLHKSFPRLFSLFQCFLHLLILSLYSLFLKKNFLFNCTEWPHLDYPHGDQGVVGRLLWPPNPPVNEHWLLGEWTLSIGQGLLFYIFLTPGLSDGRAW